MNKSDIEGDNQFFDIEKFNYFGRIKTTITGKDFMKIEPTPDINIHNLIIQKISNLDEFQFNYEIIQDYDEKLESSDWTYYFQHENSNVKLIFGYSVLKSGDPFIFCNISKSKKEWFSFEDYLTFIKVLDLQNLIRPSDHTEYVEKYLDILVPHLQTGLKEVVKGQTWLNVPFNWSTFDPYF